MNKISEHYQPFLEATEKAAIAAAKLRGCKDGKLADQAATEAMRSVLSIQDILTTVVIGEGERDEAPMLFIGEQLGNQNSDIKVDIAVDPLECTNHCAFDLPDSIAVLAGAPSGSLLHAPDTYMNKLCGRKELIGHIGLTKTVEENLTATANVLNKEIKDLKVIIMDRDRHKDLIASMHSFGIEPILIGDGDVTGGLKAVEGEVDLLYGIGAAPEGVITATAVRALGGFFEGQLVFYDEEFEKRARKMVGSNIDKIWNAYDLCTSDDTFVIASGVCTGWVPGVKFEEHKAIVTSKIIFGGNREIKVVINEYNLGELDV
ncbi:MAG: fructose-bisphosphatase class II [Candidatus Marinimicrobia bacterium]|jgi:fructose-1,6-bisphosphatase class II|nr:fructose-bisphosphatase class II [Candidatus Neomarinimicrobiota bacterium]MBT3943953.1 fructose-bisphosphatase class II [Candidatus Neomarinimicrobiota bacterium]MBT4317109.1 fructose-bisphosphatase class II [Candidatus Neomarinimicrobiota bacterium]MBT4706712.1 fructose-bisphosphatase class II [Candidatus Neomarinimicrobiota bacterium]MBT4926152.1 fructose-bisphosphatase class II [Candidatus Neomarinimicrobiota bacterium]